jgi:hypothetical protein
MREKFDASKGYGGLLSKLRDSPSKMAVESLERIRKKKSSYKKELKVL